MAPTMKQIVLQILILATLIFFSVATKKYDHNDNILRSRRSTGDTGFSNTYGEPAQQSRPSTQKRRTTTKPPTTTTTSTTSSTNSEAQIAQCIRNCRFVNYADYVCGSDGVTYMNEPHFNCAVKCGRNITIAFRSSCG